MSKLSTGSADKMKMEFDERMEQRAYKKLCFLRSGIKYFLEVRADVNMADPHSDDAMLMEVMRAFGLSPEHYGVWVKIAQLPPLSYQLRCRTLRARLKKIVYVGMGFKHNWLERVWTWIMLHTVTDKALINWMCHLRHEYLVGTEFDPADSAKNRG